MGTLKSEVEIKQAIQRLSIRVAVARYELEEAIYNKTPLSLCSAKCFEIATCKLGITALRKGHVEDLTNEVKRILLL